MGAIRALADARRPSACVTRARVHGRSASSILYAPMQWHRRTRAGSRGGRGLDGWLGANVLTLRWATRAKALPHNSPAYVPYRAEAALSLLVGRTRPP